MKNFIFSVTMLSSTISFCSSETQLASLSAYALFGLLERAKIAAFSTDSFIKSGADAKGIALWNQLTYNCNQLLLKEIKKMDLLAYSRYLFELDQARLYILETIEKLHTEKKSATSAQAQKHLLTMYSIEDESFAEIRKNSKPSADWISKIPHGPILSGKHQAIFNDYIRIAKQAKKDGHPISEHELLGLLKLHQISNKQTVTLLIENLEQYYYKKEKRHHYARSLITELKGIFPSILSGFELSILSNTKDKPNLIIFAQSSAYENILHQVLRELA